MNPHPLWLEFRKAAAADAAWDSEFTPSPHDPARALVAFVDAVGPDAVPALLTLLAEGAPDDRFSACSGLLRLGPRAGSAAVEALVQFLAGRGEPRWLAAVALEHLAPERSHALGLHREPDLMPHFADHYLSRGWEPTLAFLDWFSSEVSDEQLVKLLASWRLTDRVKAERPEAVLEWFRRLARSSRSPAVRGEAANLLAGAGAVSQTAELIAGLVERGAVTGDALERVASHPDSDRLVPQLIEREWLGFLADLLQRRRVAGLRTDAAPLVPALTAGLVRRGRWPTEQHGIHDAASCMAELQDPRFLEPLVEAVLPENGGYAWKAIERALLALGPAARARVEAEQAREGASERGTRLGWVLEAFSRQLTLEETVANADSSFLSGRVEPSVWGAFRGYANALLLGPTAHAAFQLAWIDRAFGAEVTPARVAWIRSLGFRDEAFLDELARPVAKPLTGSRSKWDGGEFQKKDPRRAAEAFAAGLPSLAAHWNQEDRFTQAAQAHVARVRAATGR